MSTFLLGRLCLPVLVFLYVISPAISAEPSHDHGQNRQDGMPPPAMGAAPLPWFAEPESRDWAEANAEVGAIGGWRSYMAEAMAMGGEDAPATEANQISQSALELGLRQSDPLYRGYVAAIDVFLRSLQPPFAKPHRSLSAWEARSLQRLLQQRNSRERWLKAEAQALLTRYRGAELQLLLLEKKEEAQRATLTLWQRMRAIGNTSRANLLSQQLAYGKLLSEVMEQRLVVVHSRAALLPWLDGLAATPAAAGVLPPLPAKLLPMTFDLALKESVQVAVAAFIGDLEGLGFSAQYPELQVADDFSVVNSVAGSTASVPSVLADLLPGVDLSLPRFSFKGGDMARRAVESSYQAARQRLAVAIKAAQTQVNGLLEERSQRYQLARHWGEDVLPLARRRGEEALLQYNGMLNGIFDLAATAEGVLDTEARRDVAWEAYWLADAAAQKALVE